MRRTIFLLSLTLASYIVGFGCGSSAPTTPTQVPISVDGLDGQEDVGTDSSFKYTFDKPINKLTVSSETFFLVEGIICDPTLAIEASIECGSVQCTIIPDNPLETGTTYTVCLTAGIEYQDGTSFEEITAEFTTEGESSDNEIVVDEFADIVGDLIDPSAYDPSVSDFADTMISSGKNTIYKALEDNQFSKIGCEMDMMKRLTFAHVELARFMACYVKEMELASGTKFAGNGEFNYWNGDAAIDYMSEEIKTTLSIDEIKIRIAVKRGNSDFTAVLCVGISDEASKFMELYVDTSNNKYEGHLIEKNAPSEDATDGLSMNFDIDGLPSDFTTVSFSQTYFGNSGNDSDYGNTTLNSTPEGSNFSGYYYKTSTTDTFSGAGYLGFDRSNGTGAFKIDDGIYIKKTNINGAYADCVAVKGEGYCGQLSDWRAWASETCEIDCYDCNLCIQEEGCPEETIEIDGESVCEIPTGITETESFTIDTTDPYASLYMVADSSDFIDDVADATLPESIDAPDIEFTDLSADIDCADSDSWTDITFTDEPDFTECDTLLDESNQWREYPFGDSGSDDGCYGFSAATLMGAMFE